MLIFVLIILFHMRLHRFYIEQKIGEETEINISDPDLIHQLVNVFRFKVGDKVVVFDGTGPDCKAEIISVSKNKVVLNIISDGQDDFKDLEDTSAVNNFPEHHNFVSLYLSLIKKSNFELAAEKCTEIGVAEIHPVISERSEKKDLNLERLSKIVKEASEQSGRVTLPKVLEITDLRNAVSQAVNDNKFCVVFHTGETNCDSQTQTQPENDDKLFDEKVAVFIGPEGGWSGREMKLFKDNNFQICSLGHNILRAETAAIAAVWEAFHR